MEFENIIVYLLFNYRWVFVCFFLLPCTILYDIVSFVRKKIAALISKKPTETHLEKTKFVQEQVRRWVVSDQSAPMCTGRPGWKGMNLREPKYKKTMYNIHIELDEILEIDTKKMTVTVEPLVTMGQLSKKLIPLKLTLPLVVELDDLTVGGLIMGQGIESSSHAVGLFQNICVSYELVLGDGTLVRCSKDEDPDLFYSLPWSYGTLGFLTAVELQIVPAKRYVKLKYEPFYSLDEGIELCTARSKDKCNNQFVEGIMFTREEGVIMSGHLVNKGTNINSIGKWYKPWFFEHVRTFLTKKGTEECIPLRDYYHRHTKGLFWEFQDIVPFGNNPLFRWVFGWAMPPKVAFLKLTQTAAIKELYDKHHVLQDLIVPVQHLKQAIMFFDKEVKVYPVWLCPVEIKSEPGLVHSFSDQPELYVDIGLYGTPKTEHYESVETTKRIEEFTREVQGYQMLYAGVYSSEEEFNKMFDFGLYNRVREKMKSHKAFPNIYGKINRKVKD